MRERVAPLRVQPDVTTTDLAVPLRAKASPLFAAFTLPTEHPSFQFLSMAWNRPVPLDLLLIFFISLCWGISMVLLSSAYRSTPVATLAPFEYFSIIYGILFGYLIWQEIPTPTMLVGVILIVGSGLFIIYRERQLGISSISI